MDDADQPFAVERGAVDVGSRDGADADVEVDRSVAQRLDAFAALGDEAQDVTPGAAADMASTARLHLRRRCRAAGDTRDRARSRRAGRTAVAHQSGAGELIRTWVAGYGQYRHGPHVA